MAKSRSGTVTPLPAQQTTFPLGVVVRMTGLSADVIRAWERRYGVPQPLRTPGGTRRYRESDIARLRLLAAATRAGFPIRELAALDDAQLRARATSSDASAAGNAHGPALVEALDALQRLDAGEAERIIGFQLATLGPREFARGFALPLLEEIGERWASDRMCIASEHLATSILRSLIGSALRATPVASAGARIVFATPSGEQHELGLLLAALSAQAAGAYVLYLGADLPVDDILVALERTQAHAAAVGLATLPTARAEACLRALRAGMAADCALWVGGRGAEGVALPEGARRVQDLAELQLLVPMLAERARRQERSS